jgi:hypothetical protein
MEIAPIYFLNMGALLQANATSKRRKKNHLTQSHEAAKNQGKMGYFSALSILLMP